MGAPDNDQATDPPADLSAPSRDVPPAQPRSRWTRRLVRFVRTLVIGYVLLLGVMMLFENSLIYFPSVYPEGDWQPYGLMFEDAWFEAADGVKLHGWYVPHQQPRAVLLFAHGNAGNLSHRAEGIDTLVKRLRVSVMIFDYRGYGRSTGSPHEAGILADARAARRWLADRAGIGESQIVLMGESLGGGVLVDLAAADGARGLILENTFSSMPEVAAFHYSWLPVRWLMRTRLDSLSKIGNYHGPLLQIHGDADRIIPLMLAQRLYEAANPPKQFVLIPQGDHNDPRRGLAYQAMDQFLDTLPAESRASVREGQ